MRNQGKTSKTQLNQIRNWQLRKLYGINIEEYARMEVEQGGLCASCKKTNRSRRLCVDHDKKTGRVRALLCMSCNFAVGYVKESSEVAEALVKYIRRYVEA